MANYYAKYETSTKDYNITTETENNDYGIGTETPFQLIPGEKGEKGEKGDTGEQGEQGVSGVYIGTSKPSEGYSVWIDTDDSETVTVPTKTSDLTNDNGFITLSDVPEGGVTSYNDLTDKPTIPSKTSQLENDSGYLTEHQSLSAYALKTEIPEVPTKTSDLTNDSGFITIDDVPSGTSSGVTSVNSKTGAVVLDAEDVGALPTTGGTATGKIIVTANSAAGFESVRTVSNQEKRAGFFVNSDGTSKFVNKNGNTDSASLIFDNTGVYYALGNNGSKATGKLMATQEYVDEHILELPTGNYRLNRENVLLATWDIAQFVEDNPDTTEVSFSFTSDEEYDELWLKCEKLKGSTTTASGFYASVNGKATNTQIISYNGLTNGGSGFTILSLAPYGTRIEKIGPANSPTNYALGNIASPYNISCANTDKIKSISVYSNDTYPAISGTITVYGVKYYISI